MAYRAYNVQRSKMCNNSTKEGSGKQKYTVVRF